MTRFTASAIGASLFLCSIICAPSAGSANAAAHRSQEGEISMDSSWFSEGAADPAPPRQQEGPSADKIASAFGTQGIRMNKAEAAGIRANVCLAIDEARAHGIGNSKVDFAAVEIASDLGLGTDNATLRRIVAAIQELMPESLRAQPKTPPIVRPRTPVKRIAPVRPSPEAAWGPYYDETLNLWNSAAFMGLMRQNEFFPVKISWEDIGRDQGSVWGARISDVGIWVRKKEGDLSSARLALSVRRDSNFRDKVLMVPAERIKVHTSKGGRTIEKTLPQRLAELGLQSPNRDRNVIVSSQFAIVPVPAHDMGVAAPRGAAPRVAFNFSIFPYGSTNYVITDVIEGSSDAIVGPGEHQLLFANIGGKKAPFTASRAEDRQDLLKLERELRAKGMDVDVQRYYLIQIPIRRDAKGITLSNMGTPPRGGFAPQAVFSVGSPKIFVDPEISYPDLYVDYEAAPAPAIVENTVLATADVIKTAKPSDEAVSKVQVARGPGLARVAIGHGESEGPYSAGSGHRGARADEPIRVTVVYFVTPRGGITEADMTAFTEAFSQWDGQAIWGGSFVTKE